jgi:D-beta-D-heptose 7-phosphate kinase/D-beta-D-heptose 1-phosphate adenosyltransferase
MMGNSTTEGELVNIAGTRYFSNVEKFEKVLKKIKDANQKLVLTQGVYDLIHEGHAKYLQLAKSYGDLLVVGVDSDKLTRARKGPSRPIVPQKERIQMLLHLRHVDFVVLRDINEDIGNLIRTIQPDVLVTSHSTKDMPESITKEYEPYCGKIVTLQPQSTTSTTARIRKLTIDGASSLADEINKLTAQFIDKLHQT